LLATIFEVIEAEPLPLHRIENQVEEAWPRLRMSDAQLPSACAAAVQIEHVNEQPPAPGQLARYVTLSTTAVAVGGTPRQPVTWSVTGLSGTDRPRRSACRVTDVEQSLRRIVRTREPSAPASK
jgi:hypothetical protein